MVGSLLVETNGNPTPASNKAWVGAAIGLLSFNIPGAIVGYFIGKSQGEKQAMAELTSNRKVVEDPTFWNPKAAEGFVKGTFYGALGGAAIILAGLAIGTVGVATFGGLTTLLAAPMVLAGFGILVFGGAFGLLKGGNDGKQRMIAEYQSAEQAQQRFQQQGVSRQRTVPEIEHEVPARTQTHLQEQQQRRAAGAGVSTPIPS